MPLAQKSIVNATFLKALFDCARTTTIENRIRVEYCSRRAVVEILREACRMAIECGQEYINAESILNAWKRMQSVNEALNILATRPMADPEAAAEG
ncbi:hypothetical protein D3C77_601080 [compost metagenome]